MTTGRSSGTDSVSSGADSASTASSVGGQFSSATAQADCLRGRVNSIETMSVVDGPGIRMVVFLQGCLLRCGFCHNPETWDVAGGSDATVEAIMNRLIRCRRMVPQIGLTLSGGEPLLQPGFVGALLKEATQLGVHTAVDTSGFCDTETLLRLAPVVGVFLYDIKAVDDRLHRQITGVGNQLILDNLRALSGIGARLVIRRVLVPGVNDTGEEAEAFRGIMQRINGVEKVDVLPFHRMALSKWSAMGMQCPYASVATPSAAEVLRFCEMIGCRSEALIS